MGPREFAIAQAVKFDRASFDKIYEEKLAFIRERFDPEDPENVELFLTLLRFRWTHLSSTQLPLTDFRSSLALIFALGAKEDNPEAAIDALYREWKAPYKKEDLERALVIIKKGNRNHFLWEVGMNHPAGLPKMRITMTIKSAKPYKEVSYLITGAKSPVSWTFKDKTPIRKDGTTVMKKLIKEKSYTSRKPKEYTYVVTEGAHWSIKELFGMKDFLEYSQKIIMAAHPGNCQQFVFSTSLGWNGMDVYRWSSLAFFYESVCIETHQQGKPFEVGYELRAKLIRELSHLNFAFMIANVHCTSFFVMDEEIDAFLAKLKQATTEFPSRLFVPFCDHLIKKGMLLNTPVWSNTICDKLVKGGPSVFEEVAEASASQTDGPTEPKRPKLE